jgi:hypothetical protein
MKYVVVELAGRRVSAVLLDTKAGFAPKTGPKENRKRTAASLRDASGSAVGANENADRYGGFAENTETAAENSGIALSPGEGTVILKKVTGILPAGHRGGALHAPDVIAKFVARLLKVNKLKKYPVSILLDTDQITTVAFSHYPAPADKMRNLVQMYAGTSLPGKVDDYAIAYSARKLVHADGQNRSTLYAAPAAQVKRFYQTFQRAGIKVYSVEASEAAFSRLVLASHNGCSVADLSLKRKPAEKAPKEKAKEKKAKKRDSDQTSTEQPPEPASQGIDPSASITRGAASVYMDFGEHSVLVSVCVDQRILFEQAFPSVFQDMADAYEEIVIEGQGGKADFSEFLYNTGLQPDAPVYEMYPELYRRMTMLIDVTMDEIFRTLRITFSSERTDAESMTVTGDLASMPGLFQRIVQYSSNFVPEDRLFQSEMIREAGAAAPKRPYSENLLFTYFRKQSQMATIAIVACGLLLAAAMIFPAQYMTRKNEQARLDRAKAKLASDLYTEVKELLAEEERIQGLQAQYDRALAEIPFDSRSKAAQFIQLIHNESVRFTQSVAIKFDNQTGVFSLSFVTRSLEQYMAFEEALTVTGVFEIGIPLDLNVSGACSGTVEVRIKNFAPGISLPTEQEETGNEGGVAP